MCSTVRSVCDWHQCLDLVELIVALLCIPDSAAHVHGLRNLAKTCNGLLQPHMQSIRACTSVCSWNQCFDLAELVVALVCIFSSAAHIRGLSSSTHLCSGPGRPYLQIIEACISVHDQYRPSSLLQSQTMGGCGVCRMLAKLFLQIGAWTRFSEYAVMRFHCLHFSFPLVLASMGSSCCI